MKYEVRPVKYYRDTAEVVADNSFTTFGIYLNLDDGTQEHIADIDEKANADLIAELLNNNKMVLA